jgi:cell division septation protein DedD
VVAPVDTTRAHRDTTTPTAPPPAKPDSTKPAARPDTTRPVPAPAPARTIFTVQVASLKTETQATSLAEMLGKDGFAPHIVNEADGSRKVRAGRFATRAEADAWARKLRVKYGPVFVVEERP